MSPCRSHARLLVLDQSTTLSGVRLGYWVLTWSGRHHRLSRVHGTVIVLGHLRVSGGSGNFVLVGRDPVQVEVPVIPRYAPVPPVR